MLLESGFKKPEKEPALQHGQCRCGIGVFEAPEAKVMKLLFGPPSLERVFLEGDYRIFLGCVVIEIEPRCLKDGAFNFSKLGRLN
jgi:hypothetical protein